MDRKWIGDFDIFGKHETNEKKTVDFEVIEKYEFILHRAEEIFGSSLKNAPKLGQQISYGEAEHLRWWLHPIEALNCLKNNEIKAKVPPFTPRKTIQKSIFKESTRVKVANGKLINKVDLLPRNNSGRYIRARISDTTY